MVSDWGEQGRRSDTSRSAGLTKTMAPRTDDTIKEYPLPVIKSDWGEYYKNVIAAIQGNEQPLITHEQVRRSTKLMEAIFESHATNSGCQV
jgi:predicted dehydrogenase